MPQRYCKYFFHQIDFQQLKSLQQAIGLVDVTKKDAFAPFYRKKSKYSGAEEKNNG